MLFQSSLTRWNIISAAIPSAFASFDKGKFLNKNSSSISLPLPWGGVFGRFTSLKSLGSNSILDGIGSLNPSSSFVPSGVSTQSSSALYAII